MEGNVFFVFLKWRVIWEARSTPDTSVNCQGTSIVIYGSAKLHLILHLPQRSSSSCGPLAAFLLTLPLRLCHCWLGDRAAPAFKLLLPRWPGGQKTPWGRMMEGWNWISGTWCPSAKSEHSLRLRATFKIKWHYLWYVFHRFPSMHTPGLLLAREPASF